MTLNQLRYFCTASRCHSITKAAEELYVTQPTVSVAIRDLEIEFGIRFLRRHPLSFQGGVINAGIRLPCPYQRTGGEGGKV